MWTIVRPATISENPWCAASQDGVGRLLVEQHENHDARAAKHVRRRVRHGHAQCAQWDAPLGRAIPDNEICTGPDEVERHRLSHDAESDETDRHL